MIRDHNSQRLELAEHIIQAAAPSICDYFCVDYASVINKERGTAREARARSMLMLLLFKWHGFNSYEVGRAIGRHHSTVANGIEAAEEVLLSLTSSKQVVLDIFASTFRARCEFVSRSYTD